MPAVGAGIVGKGGDLTVAVVGTRVRGEHDPVRLEDRWHIGSCGKSITAVLYARLVERGDAEWGAPLPALFPDLTDTDPAWRTVTIDEVFVHEGGLSANLDRKETVAAYQETRPLPEQRTAATAAALAVPPHRRGDFVYSNLGYILIGAAIERLTGVPFESALATHVLEPCDVTSAGFGPPPDLWGHGAGRQLRFGRLGTVSVGRGEPTTPDDVHSDNPAVMTPAGRLHVTLGDWAKLQRIFLDDGFLHPETIERLLTPAAGRGHRQALGWAPAAGIDHVSLGQQGSNTFWVATALIDQTRQRTAMVVCNDGRTRMLTHTAKLASQLLAPT